jgi:hypothetical protein
MTPPKQQHQVTNKHSVISQNTVTSSPILRKPQIIQNYLQHVSTTQQNRVQEEELTQKIKSFLGYCTVLTGR